MHRLDYIGIFAILLLLGLRESTDLHTQIPDSNPFTAADAEEGAAPWDDGVLTLDLIARDGAWLVREEGGEPAVKAWDVGPGSPDDDPITRVPQGALVLTRIRNATSRPLEVRGPWSQGGMPLERLEIPPQNEGTAWFAAEDRGRFEYRAVHLGEAHVDREPRSFNGAFVVVPEIRPPR
jgi:hypothetical protein